jgi:hypothetical protein
MRGQMRGQNKRLRRRPKHGGESHNIHTASKSVQREKMSQPQRGHKI